MYEYDVSGHDSEHICKVPSQDAIHLARFMVWAYDEVSHNLKDDVLKSAIKAILYYMAKRYGVETTEDGALAVAEQP